MQKLHGKAPAEVLELTNPQSTSLKNCKLHKRAIVCMLGLITMKTGQKSVHYSQQYLLSTAIGAATVQGPKGMVYLYFTCLALILSFDLNCTIYRNHYTNVTFLKTAFMDALHRTASSFSYTYITFKNSIHG